MVLYEKAKAGNLNLTVPVFAFFYAVCRNLWFKKLRKQSFKSVSIKEELIPEDDDGVEEAVLLENQYQLYRKKLNELSESCRRIMTLFFHKTSMPEIMKTMEFSSEQYTRKRKFQCKENLVKQIKSDPSYQSLHPKFARL